MRFLRNSMMGLFLTAMSIGLLFYAVQLLGGAIQERMARERPALEVQERVYVVSLVPAQSATHTPVLRSFGEIKSRRTLELRAAVGGRVVALAPQFEDGGQVKRGMLLLQIDPSDMQSAFDRFTADLADAQAEVRDADRGLELARQEETAAQEQALLRERALNRQLDLAGRGVGTAAAVEESEIALGNARASVLTRKQSVAQAEARIDQAATRLARAEIALIEATRKLEDTSVEAPFDGTLNETTVVEGGLITANEKLADLIDPADLEVAFRVSTGQYARFLDANGALIPAIVTVTLESNTAELEATGILSRVDAAAGEGQSGRLMFARLDRAFGFRPGDFVTVMVEEPPLEDVVRLPSSALGADQRVLVLGPEDRLEEIAVTLLRRQGNDVLVRGENLSGREVVRQRTPLLGAGFAVRPIRPEARDASAQPDVLNLTPSEREKLIALVKASAQMTERAKASAIDELSTPAVSAQTAARIKRKAGG